MTGKNNLDLSAEKQEVVMTFQYAHIRFYLWLSFAALAAFFYPLQLPAAELFIGDKNAVAQYTTSDKVLNRSLISGLKLTFGVAISKNDIYVANEDSGVIGKYSITGKALNASLISGLNGPAGIAITGNRIFVANYRSDSIGEYTTSGRVINAALISGLAGPEGLAVVGRDIYVVNFGAGTVGK